MQTNSRPWSVAIFTARESIATLSGCVQAVLAACNGRKVTIDVLVNGNRALADEAERLIASLVLSDGSDVRLWFIRVGDKAHTWNHYIHHIWRPSELTFFIDGYVEVRPDALMLIEQGLEHAPAVLGATGVPTSGPSANFLRKQMLAHGGIHGNLYAIRGTAMLALRERGFRLPLGLYRTDSLVGAVLMFRLDPSHNDWDSGMILVHPDATWQVHRMAWWSFDHLLTIWKRKLRQAQGELENRAVREHLSIEKRRPEDIPATARELVACWVAACPDKARVLFVKHPLTYYAMHKLMEQRDWSATSEPPALLCVSAPGFASGDAFSALSRQAL